MEGLDPATRRDRIEAGRVVLRRAMPGDLAMIHAAMSDPGVMRYWATPSHADLATSRDWLEAMIAADPAISDDFIIEHDGQAIGKIGCWRLPEFGYLLHPDYQGRGLASEALVALVGYMRGRGLPKLKADVDPRNAPSLRLLERAGFAVTGHASGTWLVAGELCDSVYLELALNPS
ncbi:MAG: GNAT family N-acetyltransferase [Pseudomonadota bacterium]|nr:GNAT family N-acetyltransferase [Pseudomonadota bacterium]